MVLVYFSSVELESISDLDSFLDLESESSLSDSEENEFLEILVLEFEFLIINKW